MNDLNITLRQAQANGKSLTYTSAPVVILKNKPDIYQARQIGTVMKQIPSARVTPRKTLSNSRTFTLLSSEQLLRVC
jgi:hypothetical protein